jgi:hypothetical protein
VRTGGGAVCAVVVAPARAVRGGVAAIIIVIVVDEDGRGRALGFFGDFAVEAFCLGGNRQRRFRRNEKREREAEK